MTDGPRLVSLCSGYGGLDIAIEKVTGATTIAHVEHDKWASKVLARRWPGIPNYGDLTTLDWGGLGDYEMLAAGFPCQPVSQAGQRGVHNDPRWLWPFIAQGVSQTRPEWVVLENVPGLLGRWRDKQWERDNPGLGECWRPPPIQGIVDDLAALGYVGAWGSLRASDVGACHRRRRVFVVAHATDQRGNRGGDQRRGRAEPADVGSQSAAHPDGNRLAEGTGFDGRTPQRVIRTRPDVDGLGREDGRVQQRWWEWDKYQAAIDRHIGVMGALPPHPVDARDRLSPRFVEWMMMLDGGWVTGVKGVSRTQQLKMLGNGVVWLQAAVALQRLGLGAAR